MSRRLVFVVLCCLSYSVVDLAIAQNLSTPNAEERKQITDCLDTARKKETPAEACLNLVSQACQTMPGGETTVGMRMCMERETVIWDEILNRNYRALRKAVSSDGAKKLGGIQRQWIKWRDAKCEMPYILYEGGSLARPLAAECVLRATALRAIEFGAALDAIEP